MATEVTPPDLVGWATDYARALRATRTVPGFDDLELVDVGLMEPEVLTGAGVYFRDDGGPKKSIVTWSRSMGVSVLAGSRRNPAPAIALTRMLFGAFTDEGLPVLARPCPVASVDGSNGPYLVREDADRTRMYFTVEYTVFGTPAVVAG